VIEFFAPGVARPKGSKRLVRTRGGRTLLLEDSKREAPWRQVCTMVGLESMKGAPPFEGAVDVEMVFFFPRPKSHFTKKGLRPDAPTHHIARPDVSKLVRSVEDALNGVVFKDDSAIARLVTVKLYTEGTPGVHVRVRPLNQPGAGLAALIAAAPCRSE
jgi:crossover junction endodeoxyribonuclease RusA